MLTLQKRPPIGAVGRCPETLRALIPDEGTVREKLSFFLRLVVVAEEGEPLHNAVNLEKISKGCIDQRVLNAQTCTPMPYLCTPVAAPVSRNRILAKITKG